MTDAKPKTHQEYIDQAPEQARPHLRRVYAILKEVAPEAKEAVKWGSPVFEENRILYAFSAFKAHLNFMPTASSLEPFAQELEGFTTGKGTVQLPYDRPVPEELVRKIAEHRARDVRENDARWM